MSIIFVDRNRELVDTIDALGLCITSASDYFQLAREVVNPVLMTASNPMWTFGGGIDAAFRREFPELVEKKMETGGDMDRLGNICFCVTVDGELNASRELVEYPAGGMIALTNAGREVARIENPPTSNADLHERIYSVLNPAEGKILRPIIDAFIQVRKADVAAVSGYSETSSNFVKILGKLRTLGLIDYPEPGYVRATSILFPIS